MFGLEPYHILLVAMGVAIVLSYWLPRFLSGREPAASAMLVLTGALAFMVPGMPAAPDPVVRPGLWEKAAELCVVIGLFGTGLRIDRLPGRAQWHAAAKLLAVAMPLSIAALALLGWVAAGMTIAGGLLLGAVLAPTDPVLAGDVQVGPPHEGGEHPLRYTLTAEAGLNDGLAFPFVHLAMMLAAAGGATFELAGEWLMRDVLYRIVVGTLGGWAIGWLLGNILFCWPRSNALSRTGSGVVALAGVLIAYGLTEVIEGYGFIAAFVAGLALRRMETHDRFHKRLHDFSESLEHALTALLLVSLGAAVPALLPWLDWRHALVGAALIFVVRPAAGYVALLGTPLRGRQRAVAAFYGVRGIGSIYYLAYAGTHVALVNERTLWATVAFTISLSTVVHGLTAGVAVERATGEADPNSPDSGAGKNGPRSA